MASKSNAKLFLMEFLGSFVLVLVSCWSFVSLSNNQIGYLGLGLCNGLVLAFLLWAGSTIDLVDLNPVVTIVKLGIRNFPLNKSITIILLQLFGSFLAALIVVLLLPNEYSQKEETVIGHPNKSIMISDFQAFIIEFICSLIYVFVYFATLVDKRAPSNIFGFSIGGVMITTAVALGPYTGACVNPLRIFGPQLISGKMDFAWIYWIANIFGGVFAGFYYDFFLLKNEELADEEEEEHSKNMRNTENLNQAMNLKY